MALGRHIGPPARPIPDFAGQFGGGGWWWYWRPSVGAVGRVLGGWNEQCVSSLTALLREAGQL